MSNESLSKIKVQSNAEVKESRKLFLIAQRKPTLWVYSSGRLELTKAIIMKAADVELGIWETGCGELVL